MDLCYSDGPQIGKKKLEDAGNLVFFLKPNPKIINN
jgi:hypothetical protein